MGHLNMSIKERTQLIVFEKLKNGEISKVEAALQLKISERWVREKFKRYLEHGDTGLVHKSRSKISEKRWCEKEKELSLELLRSEWLGFGPTFAAEKLDKLKGIKVSKETLRQAMIKGGIWQARQGKRKHRKRRERRAILGLLIQLDGSPHDWFEGRGPKCTLLVFIDDATSKLLWLEFVKSESRVGVMQATKNYVSLHGLPHEFYVDFGGVFSVNLNNKERDKKTQWERAAAELGIEIIHARSPQAKGRVERVNRTLQDRLVNEMRIAGISSIDEANQFIRTSSYLADHNQLFSEPAAQQGNAHRPAQLYNLDNIFCIREKRILANDYTIVYNKRIFQLHAQQRTIIRPKDAITISTHLNGSIKLSVRKIDLSFEAINARPQKQIQEKKVQYKSYKPSKNSRLWASGMMPLLTTEESRVKIALPATEAK